MNNDRKGKNYEIKDLKKGIKDKDIGDLTVLINKSLKTNFVEEESVIDVRFVNETSAIKMIVDNGVPYYIVSTKWIAKYMDEEGVDKDEMEYEDCFKRFRFGENIYESKTKIKFPVIVKDVTSESIMKKVMHM